MIKINKKEINSDSERLIITGYIVSDLVLTQLTSIHNDKYFQVDFIKAVSRWCIEYHKQYKKAPGKDIQNIFLLKKTENLIAEDMAELVSEFLSGLSDEYEENGINETYVLDEAEKYFGKRKLELLKDELSGLLSSGDIDKADLAVTKYVRIQRPVSGSVDVITDHSAALQAINEEHDILLELPEGLGQLIGPLERGDFIGFIGPMKRGKTFWLEDFAVRGMLRGLKVLFVSLEMPKNQMLRRIYQNFIGEPRQEREVIIPYYDEYDSVQYKTIHKKGLTSKATIKKLKQLKTYIKSGAFRLICFPSHSASVSTIRTEIENLRHYEDFNPDMVVIDYADILGPEPGAPNEYRHSINRTWLEIRKLAQEIHGLCVTASQSDRSTFSNDVKEENTAEDIRKLAHVTHMIALNQTKDEKKQQIMRLSMLANRNEEFDAFTELEVLYQYGIAKAYLDSRIKNNKQQTKKEKKEKKL